VAEQSAPAAGGLGHQRTEGGAERRLNLSVLDGWWAEAYDGLNGFAIGTGRTHSNMDVHDSRDGEDLYRVLHDEVIPLYYSAIATDCRGDGSSA
jgi:glucan phosphorylase